MARERPLILGIETSCGPRDMGLTIVDAKQQKSRWVPFWCSKLILSQGAGDSGGLFLFYEASGGERQIEAAYDPEGDPLTVCVDVFDIDATEVRLSSRELPEDPYLVPGAFKSHGREREIVFDGQYSGACTLGTFTVRATAEPLFPTIRDRL